MKYALLAVLVLLSQGKQDFWSGKHEATKKFTYDQFHIVPVRVHILKSKTMDSLNCRLTKKDVRRIFGKINRIWNYGGIAVHMESILEEQAVVPSGFKGAGAGYDDYNFVRPKESQGPGVVHVYYVHAMRGNGVHLGMSKTIFACDTANLSPVSGGVDEPLPRVTAHEMGHHMGGLKHRQDRINLMASGTTGWSLNDREIGTVRGWAGRTEWALTPGQALEKEWYDILAAIPGKSEIKDQAKEKVGTKGGSEGKPADAGWLGARCEAGEGGVRVLSTFRYSSTARSMKLKKGDILLEIGGKPVASVEDLAKICSALKTGVKISVKILRDGEEKTLEGKVRKIPLSFQRKAEKDRKDWF
ncbi:MAG: PDZ domain-containing protein [Planctomycetota bacterium]|jgi:hypothetical protein